jgi:hypothetical protein
MAAIGTCICAKSCATFLPIQALYLDPFFFRLLIRCHQGTSMRPLEATIKAVLNRGEFQDSRG